MLDHILSSLLPPHSTDNAQPPEQTPTAQRGPAKAEGTATAEGGAGSRQVHDRVPESVQCPVFLGKHELFSRMLPSPGLSYILIPSEQFSLSIISLPSHGSL